MASRPKRLQAFRIADRRHDIFDGWGAASHGGRWNSPGRWVIYASETYAGAILEILVHANLGRPPKTHAWIEISIGENIRTEEVQSKDVPSWDHLDQRASRAFGDRWYDDRRTAVLLVPSVVARAERNVVINQKHPDFRKIRATAPKPIVWDHRLFGR